MTLLLLGGACAGLDWFAVGTGHPRLERLTKPLTLALLLAWWISSIPRPAPASTLWFLFGLAFSLVGDVFLLFPERSFVYGLCAFLLAQVAYTVGLNAAGPVVGGRAIAAAAAILALAVVLGSAIRRGLARRGNLRMLAPVTVYLAAVSAMLWSAATAALRPEWPAVAGGMVATGGALFFASDAILAWNRFVQPFDGARLLTRVTYHLGQYGLAIGMSLALGAF